MAGGDHKNIFSWGGRVELLQPMAPRAAAHQHHRPAPLVQDPQRIARLIRDIGGGEFVVPVRIAREDFAPDTDFAVTIRLPEDAAT